MATLILLVFYETRKRNKQLNSIKLSILPGGKLPERKTQGAVGYDVYARCILHPEELDSNDPDLRKLIWDFETPYSTGSDEVTEQKGYFAEQNISPAKEGKYRYRLKPGEKVVIGIGFRSEFSLPYFFWVTPRSGFASRDHVTVGNAPGTVDPDYRGEACVVLNNIGKKDFYVEKGMRIAQIVFCRAELPEFEVVARERLTSTKRGSAGLGSTGHM